MSVEYKGTHFKKKLNKWIAQFNAPGIQYHLGCFDTQAQAFERYKEEYKKFYGKEYIKPEPIFDYKNQTVKIPLSSYRARKNEGYWTVIDLEDWDKVKDYDWYATIAKKSRVNYASTNINRVPTRIHHIIMGRTGIDHIDSDGLNNRKANLRPANQSQNAANTRKRIGVSTSQFKGVCWSDRHNKWRAYINKEGKHKTLGLHISETDAAKAYNNAAQKLFGEYARLNQVQ